MPNVTTLNVKIVSDTQVAFVLEFNQICFTFLTEDCFGCIRRYLTGSNSEAAVAQEVQQVKCPKMPCARSRSGTFEAQCSRARWRRKQEVGDLPWGMTDCVGAVKRQVCRVSCRTIEH